MTTVTRRPPPPVLGDLSEITDRARSLRRDHARSVIGLTGAPGSGKSTLAARLAEHLGEDVVVVPMDGFHLTDQELARTGLSERKGAPETFDAAGYVATLARIREETERTVYVPEFDRDRELSIAGAIAVRPEHRLVLTEGNYLLLDTPEWQGVRPLVDEVWFVETEEDMRLDRLIRRHVAHGKSPDAAETWATTSDEANAVLIRATRDRADLVVRLD